ncbi:Protein CBG19948, partial [Caenorhabditis briggsae]
LNSADARNCPGSRLHPERQAAPKTLPLETKNQFFLTFLLYSHHFDSKPILEIALEVVVDVFEVGNDEKHTFITLGIGRDITGEQRWKRKMEKLGKTVEFYGADPMTEINEELYPQIGKYFPFAVSRTPGYATASVLKNRQYINQSVVHVDIMYFVDKLLKINKIDNLWMDAEGAEYDMFEIFMKNGSFAQNGIDVCQINIEVHLSETGPNHLNYERFMKFVKQLIREEQFAIFKTEEVIHMRISNSWRMLLPIILLISTVSLAEAGKFTPNKYELELTPEFFGDNSFTGKTKIHVDVTGSVEEFDLQVSKDLEGFPIKIINQIIVKEITATFKKDGDKIHVTLPAPITKASITMKGFIEIAYKGKAGKKGANKGLFLTNDNDYVTDLKNGNAIHLFPILEDVAVPLALFIITPRRAVVEMELMNGSNLMGEHRNVEGN